MNFVAFVIWWLAASLRRTSPVAAPVTPLCDRDLLATDSASLLNDRFKQLRAAGMPLRVTLLYFYGPHFTSSAWMAKNVADELSTFRWQLTHGDIEGPHPIDALKLDYDLLHDSLSEACVSYPGLAGLYRTEWILWSEWMPEAVSSRTLSGLLGLKRIIDRP